MAPPQVYATAHHNIRLGGCAFSMTPAISPSLPAKTVGLWTPRPNSQPYPALLMPKLCACAAGVWHALPTKMLTAGMLATIMLATLMLATRVLATELFGWRQQVKTANTTGGTQMHTTLKSTPGNWVSGEQFYNRTDDLADLEEKVQDHCHIMLTAQRRMGKTSLVHELLRRLENSGKFATYFVDLEDSTTPEAAIAEIIKQTSEESQLTGIRKWIANSISTKEISFFQTKLQLGSNRGNWKTRGDRLFDELAACNKPVVLALDELPIFIQRLCTKDKKLADEWLSWLRKATQQHQHRISIIVLGSISFAPILERYCLSATVNHLTLYELKPWDETTATGCLEALAKQYNLTLPEPICRAMCQRLRCCIPHHVQLFFDGLRRVLRTNKCSEATLEDVNSAYDELLSVRGQANMEHYRSRLKDALEGKRDQFSCALLSQAAAEGALNDDMIERQRQQLKLDHEQAESVMDLLEHDGYLERHDSGWRFVSRLLEDWWRKNGPAIPRLKGSHLGARPR